MAHTSHDITLEHLDALALSFCGRVAVGANKDCWLWTGGRNKRGYGIVHIPMRITGFDRPIAMYAHRVALALNQREVPSPELTTDHLCRTLACCNPRHLQYVTQTVNVRRNSRPITPVRVGKPGAWRWQVRLYSGPRSARRSMSKTFDTESDALAFVAQVKADRAQLPPK